MFLNNYSDDDSFTEKYRYYFLNSDEPPEFCIDYNPIEPEQNYPMNENLTGRNDEANKKSEDECGGLNITCNQVSPKNKENKNEMALINDKISTKDKTNIKFKKFFVVKLQPKNIKKGRKKKRTEEMIKNGHKNGEKTKYNLQNMSIKYRRLLIKRTTLLINKLSTQYKLSSKLKKVDTKYAKTTKKSKIEKFNNTKVEDFFAICKKNKKFENNKIFIQKVTQNKISEITYILKKTFKELKNIFNGTVDDEIIFQDYKLKDYLNDLKQRGEPEEYISQFENHAKNFESYYQNLKERNSIQK